MSSAILLWFVILHQQCRVVWIHNTQIGAQYSQSMSCSAADKLSALQIINGNDSWVQKRSNKHPYFENIYVPKSAKVTVLPATCENCIEIK